MRAAAVAILALTISACSNVDTRSFENIQAEPGGERLAPAVAFIKGGCNGSAQLAPAVLTAALAGVAADFAINYVKANIEEQKKALDATVMATGYANPGLKETVGGESSPPAKETQACLVFVYGLFGSSAMDATADINSDVISTMGLSHPPAVYVEMPIKVQGDKVFITPHKVIYGQTVARNPGSGKKNVTMLVAFSSHSKAKEDELTREKSLALYALNFGRLEAGRSYDDRSLKSVGAVDTMPDTGFNTPFNVSVVFSEHEDPSAAYGALAAAIEANREALKKVAQSAAEGGSSQQQAGQ